MDAPEKTSDPKGPTANALGYGEGDEAGSPPVSEPAPKLASVPPSRPRLRRLRRFRMARQAKRTTREIERLATPPWEKRPPKRASTRVLAVVAMLSCLAALASVALERWPGAGREARGYLDETTRTLGQLLDDASESISGPESPRREPAAEPKEKVKEPKVVAERKTPTGTEPVRTPKATPKAGAAFAVSGAPEQPAGEMTLLARAARLERFVARHPRPSSAAVRHWLRQHAWIVTGAKWGWPGGEQALVRLIEVDRQVAAAWGIGARSEARARYALRQLRHMRAHPKTRSTEWLESYALPGR